MSKMSLRGMYTVTHIRGGKVINKFEAPNAITDVGIEHIMDVSFHAEAATATWYIGLIDNDGFTALAVGDTSAVHAGWTELEDYDEAARVAWTEGAAATRSITNAVTCDFTMSATDAVNGIFLISVNTKGGGTGVLWSTASFSSVVNVVDDDVLKITYTLTG